jgi:hypothetical protein
MQKAKVKNKFYAVFIVLSLSIGALVVRQKVHAQDVSIHPPDTLADMMTNNIGAETNEQKSTEIIVTQIPPGYRDWKLISIASFGGKANDLRAKLGNDIAINAYREGKLPFPDGSIIARLSWRQVTSEDNNEAFRPFLEKQGLSPEAIQKVLAEFSVAGPAINMQFMVKDTKKYAATGGWGFAQFNDGNPINVAVPQACFHCHEPAKDQDLVFTRYAP